MEQRTEGQRSAPQRSAPQRRTEHRRSVKSQLAFHASRIIIDIGVLMAMASMSLPFIAAPDGNRSSVDADALPVILLLLPVFLITLVPDHARPLPNPLGWLALILGIAAFPYAVVKYIDATTLADTLGGEVAFGAKLLVLGAFVTVIGIAVGLARNFLHLPQGGTYPKVQAQAAPRPAPRQPARRTRPPGTSSGAPPASTAGTQQRAPGSRPADRP